MCWFCPPVPPFLVRKFLHVAFIFIRQFLCKVSYALIIISVLLMNGLIILCVNFIVPCWFPKRNPRHGGFSWVLCHLLLLKLLLSVTIGNAQSHASMSRLNWFPLLNQSK